MLKHNSQAEMQWYSSIHNIATWTQMSEKLGLRHTINYIEIRIVLRS